jgi:hypothetical protein
MASWEEFERAAPDLAAVAHRLWPGISALNRGDPLPAPGPCFSVAFLATARRDGSPRLHPFCPILATGRLFAAIPLLSPKGNDLRRDGRCVIHAQPGPEDDELCIRAVGSEVEDSALRGNVRHVVMASRVGGMIETVSSDPLFEFDLVRIDIARWLDVGQPGTRALRQHWDPLDAS